MDPRFRALVAAVLVALLTGAGLGIVIGIDDGDPATPDRTVTILKPRTVVPPIAQQAPAGDLEAPRSDASSTGVDKDEQALRDETPDGVPASTLGQADRVEAARAEDLPAVKSPLPVGGAQNYSCRNMIGGSGYYGSRAAGSKVMSFKLHYTVSGNVAGWGDVIGVVGYLKRVGLSAHLVVDFEGHCAQMVPFAMNAYAQGRFNSTSEAVEIIATGKETRAQWLASPLIKRGILAAIVRDRLRARGLPLRFVDPEGCADRLGYSDHNHLECGNNHTDVAPAFPFDVFQRQLADGPKPVTIVDRGTCAKLNAWRRAGRPAKRARPELGGPAVNVRRRRALERRNVKCLASGPVRSA